MRILLAEPSRIGRTIVAKVLEEGGHEVIGCESAEAALAALEADAGIEVLVTAIEFLGMSGLELCWSARLATGNERPLFIVVMSSSTDERRLEEALDAGADEFVQKPPKKTEILARLRSAARMLDAQRELVRLASYDVLTGLRNRRAFFADLEELAAGAETLSLITLDIDYFKQVNDKHGHDGGDLVLKEVANRLAGLDRNFARIGGEEFALAWRGPIERAGLFAEQVRREIAARPVQLPTSELAVTVSIGVAQRQEGVSIAATMKDADVALYASKSGGRNQVTLARIQSNSADFAPPAAKVA